jgi:ABC-type transport system substrate-binding protein
MTSARLRALLAALSFASLASPAAASFTGSAGASADRDATLTLMEGAYPKTLNPIIYSLAVEADIIRTYTIFETLVEMDPDTGEAVCWLCESYSYDPSDKRVVTFKLRPDLTFHDGKPLTSADVKFSFDVMVHPKVDNLQNKSDVMAAVEKIEAIDPTTVKITFKGVKYANIYQISVPIIPKHLFPYFDKTPEQFNKDQKFGRKPLGSGPYKFVKWESDKFVELERNADWWGFKANGGKGDPRFAGAFNFKKIRYKIVTNDNVGLQAFKKGEFDYMDLASYQYDELSKAKDLAKIQIQHLVPKVGTSFMFIGWNGRLPMFADVKTREALSLLTNREETLKKFSKGLRPPTNGPWGITSPYQCPKEKCPVLPFDPARAKKLLAEAGWADSNKDGCLDRKVDGKDQTLKFAVLAGEDDWSKNVMSVYTTEMQKAGVCATIRQLDWTAMIKLIDDLNFEAYISGWQSGYPILPRQLFHSENVGKTGSNTVNFVDKEADKLIGQFEEEFDAQKRMAIGQQIHAKIYDSHAMTFHHEGGGCYLGHNKSLAGVAVADFSPTCTFWPRWFKEKKK